MDNKKSYVYKITCLVTNEYYFGSSFYIMRNSYWGTGRKIKERISKYGKENFVKEILGEFDDRTIAHQVENYYIEKFRNDEKCLNQQLDHKFGTYGVDSCAKKSAANIGKTFSEEHKAKLSAAHRGKHLSNETRTKIGVARLGKHRTEEVKAKLSASHLGIFRGKHWRKNPVTGKREYYD